MNIDKKLLKIVLESAENGQELSSGYNAEICLKDENIKLVSQIKQSILKAIMEKKRVMAHIEGTKRVETPWVTLEDVEEVLSK